MDLCVGFLRCGKWVVGMRNRCTKVLRVRCMYFFFIFFTPNESPKTLGKCKSLDTARVRKALGGFSLCLLIPYEL